MPIHTRRSTTRSRCLVLAFGASLAVVVTGCGAPDEPAASPSPSSSLTTPSPGPTSGPTPGPTPSPAATVDRPPVDALVLRTSGLGPLTIGVAPETNPGAAMILFDPDVCAGVAEASDPRGPGRWVAAYPPFVDADGNERPQFWVDANEADGVYWIDVVDPAISTTTGIRVGSTLAELQAAYPGLVEGTPGPASQPWWVADDAGILVFEVSAGADGQPPASGSGVVIIHLQGPGTDPDWTSANTDLVAGGCL